MAFRRSPVRSRSGPPTFAHECRRRLPAGARSAKTGLSANAFHVEFFELAGVSVDPYERELLAQFLSVAIVRVDVDRALEQERLVQAVKLGLNEFGASKKSTFSRSVAYQRASLCERT